MNQTPEKFRPKYTSPPASLAYPAPTAERDSPLMRELRAAEARARDRADRKPGEFVPVSSWAPTDRKEAGAPEGLIGFRLATFIASIPGQSKEFWMVELVGGECDGTTLEICILKPGVERGEGR